MQTSPQHREKMLNDLFFFLHSRHFELMTNRFFLSVPLSHESDASSAIAESTAAIPSVLLGISFLQ